MINLKNLAFDNGATYAKIERELDSYKSMSCDTNLYKVVATIYKEDPDAKVRFFQSEKLKEEKRIAEEEARDLIDAKKLMELHIRTCTELGFKPNTESMSYCLLTQQTRHDAKLEREQNEKNNIKLIKQAQGAEYRRQLAEQEREKQRRLESERRMLLDNMQKSIEKGVSAPGNINLPKTTHCTVGGSSILCTGN